MGVDEGNREEAVGGDLGEAGAELGESPDQVRVAGRARYEAFLPARVENFYTAPGSHNRIVTTIGLECWKCRTSCL